MIRNGDIRRDCRGFTLVETLVALIVVVLLCVALGVAIPAALKVMHNSTLTSNAEVLSSSLESASQDALRYAAVEVDSQGNVKTNAAGNVLFDNTNIVDSAGNSLTAAYMTADKYVILREDAVTGGRSACSTNLLSTGVYTDFTITDFTLTYDTGTNAFSGEYTITSKDGVFTRDYRFSCVSLVGEKVVASS